MVIFNNICTCLFNTARWICGWKSAINIPQKDCVSVYCHTSYWEGFILFLYSNDAHIITVLKPQLFTWWSSPFLRRLGYIPGPRLEDRGNGGVQIIINQLLNIKKISTKPVIFLISPKGTIQNRPWRTGYKYIAQGLNWPVIPMRVDYSRRTVVFEEVPNNSMEIDDLQNILSLGCPRIPSRSEIDIKISYDPYELLGVIDLVTFSNISMLPAIFHLYSLNDYYTGFLALGVFCTSWCYHSSCEKHYAKFDSIMAKILITFALLKYYRNISIQLVMTCIITFWLYYIGTPRNHNDFRGTYVVYHSIYHCVLSYAAYQLVSA